MKKLVKNLLFGAGIAAVGLAVYSLWKDAEEPVVVQDVNVEPPTTTPTKEYVERRRQQIRDAAEARRAAQEVPQEEVPQEEVPQEEVPQEEVPKDGAAQEEAPDTVPVESDSSEQASERQKEQ